MHHHDEDDHVIATHFHKAKEHHCELDEQFCQPSLNEHCGHDTHIAKPIGKCFTCAFHFIKYYEPRLIETANANIIKHHFFAQPVSVNILNVIIELSNKGPPTLLS
jgi:hypothetical protein